MSLSVTCWGLKLSPLALQCHVKEGEGVWEMSYELTKKMEATTDDA